MRFIRLVLILGFGALLVGPPETESCGPFVPTAQFGFINNPGPEFAKGELGVLQRTYWRRNLVVAYRYLTGAPLSAEEAQAFDLRHPAVLYDPKNPPPLSPPDAWLAARRSVPGAAPVQRIDTDRATLLNGIYLAYRNCLDDAFSTAGSTLSERIKRWGAGSPQVAEWLRGQDEVFANCGGDRPDFSGATTQIARAAYHEPAQLPPGADPLLAADRQYQIAAARLYGGKYKEAAEAFRAVAADSASPWRSSGRYLAARAVIRQATVSGERSALVEAEASLESILRDPAEQRWHASARGLLQYLHGISNPEDRMVELAGQLSKPESGAAFQQALTDYTMIWDRIQKGPAARSELADWITAFQAGDAPHAVEQWRVKGSDVWLIAALTAVNPADAAAPELTEAARKIKPSSPAYASAAYHGIRILTARGQRDEARTWADAALAVKAGVTAHNAFLSERMALARDWTDFLRYAPRTPVAAVDYMPDGDLNAQWLKVTADPAFDDEATSAINRSVPLDLWLTAAGSPELTPRLKAGIAQAGWVRAVILDRPSEARRLAPLLGKLRPELAEAMRQYESEKTAGAARFSAVLTMLRNPGLGPLVRSGFGRLTAVTALDSLRDNWWLLEDPEPGRWFWAANRQKTAPGAAPAFLTDAQREEGEKQWQALQSGAPVAPDYLCAQTLAWAQTHRDDPRVPEALHLAVRATRYGMTRGETSQWSKRAFQLLHARYPKSEWAAKTKYWY
jgi:tetratricopeptide (TPR) repeat protein